MFAIHATDRANKRCSNWPDCRGAVAAKLIVWLIVLVRRRIVHATDVKHLQACIAQNSDPVQIMGSAQLLQELSGHVDRVSELQSKHSSAFEDLRLQQTKELQQHFQNMLQKHRDLMASISAEAEAHQKV